MKIVLVTMTIRPEVVEALTPVGRTAMTAAATEAEAVSQIAHADAVIISDNAYTPAIAAALKASKPLKWLQIMTAGYDNATRLGVPERAVVTSVGDAFSPSVAVHALSLMLALLRGVLPMIESQRTGTWNKAIANHLVMPEGKTVLVLGYGSIGEELAKLVAPLGMKVVGTNRNGQPRPHAEIHKADELHSLLPLADVLVVAAPSRPETDSIVGARELALMKKTAVLVNISRGKLVDTLALDAALRGGVIAGAALDVTEPEPLPKDHPLWSAPNLIVSPHVAGAAGMWAANRQAERVASNLRLFLAGKPVENVVRP